MTNWQIFALSSPVIIAAVMWLQGLAEGHFEYSGSSRKTSTTGDGSSSHVETSTKKAVPEYGDLLAETAEAFRILSEAFRLEAVKIEPDKKKETSSTSAAGSDVFPKRVS